MKKILTLVTIICINLCSYSQTNNPNEITAEGNSKINVKPDIGIFKITVEKRNEIEKIAIKELNDEIGKLQDVLMKIGFSNKEIKISDFELNSEQNREEKKIYYASNSLKVEFGINNILIDLFYQEIQLGNFKDLDVEFETQISTELENISRKKLVKLAISDAKSNAENIASELNLKLVNIKKVTKYGERDYDEMISGSAVKFVKPSLKSASEVIQKTSFDKFEVEEKQLEETITIIYEITKS